MLTPQQAEHLSELVRRYREAEVQRVTRMIEFGERVTRQTDAEADLRDWTLTHGRTYGYNLDRWISEQLGETT